MKDIRGEEITPERILDAYLNTGDYDDRLGGWVAWERGRLTFAPDTERGAGLPVCWALELNPGQMAIPEQA